jgi:hypothetical protein
VSDAALLAAVERISITSMTAGSDHSRAPRRRARLHGTIAREALSRRRVGRAAVTLAEGSRRAHSGERIRTGFRPSAGVRGPFFRGAREGSGRGTFRGTLPQRCPSKIRPSGMAL